MRTTPYPGRRNPAQSPAFSEISFVTNSSQSGSDFVTSLRHVPLYCRDEFLGKSGAGLYGDVMMEIDRSLGEVMKTIRETAIER